MHDLHCCGCVFLNPSLYPCLKACFRACSPPAGEGFRSSSLDSCCSKYFWIIMFNSASVGDFASRGACSPAFRPISYAARSSAVLPCAPRWVQNTAAPQTTNAANPINTNKRNCLIMTPLQRSTNPGICAAIWQRPPQTLTCNDSCILMRMVASASPSTSWAPIFARHACPGYRLVRKVYLWS